MWSTLSSSTSNDAFVTS